MYTIVKLEPDEKPLITLQSLDIIVIPHPKYYHRNFLKNKHKKFRQNPINGSVSH